MSEQTRAYLTVLSALCDMKGHRIDRKWVVAANVVAALVNAGFIPPHGSGDSDD